MKSFIKRHKRVAVGTDNCSDGFTIVELMIALSILSTILVICTVVMIQIGVLYSKGVNAANLQNITRTVVADISSSIQFSYATPPGCTPQASPPTCYEAVNTTDFIVNGTPVPIYAYCIGTTRYSYILDRELGSDNSSNPAIVTPHVLWRDTIVANKNPTCQPLDISQQTVSADSSSNDTASGNPIASGGYEMMGDHMRLTGFNIFPTTPINTIYSVNINTAYGDNDLLIQPNQYNCKGTTGNQFCATSQISTAITRRLLQQ